MLPWCTGLVYCVGNGDIVELSSAKSMYIWKMSASDYMHTDKAFVCNLTLNHTQEGYSMQPFSATLKKIQSDIIIPNYFAYMQILNKS